MEELVALLQIDFVSYILVTFTLLTGIAAINTILGKVFPGYKGPVAWWRKFNEDREMIAKNAEDIKNLAQKHNEDVSATSVYERNLEDKLTTFMQEMKEKVEQLGEKVEQFADNRIHDREQSRQIQKELVDSQVAISQNQNQISEKINVLAQMINEVKTNTDSKFAESEEKNNQRVRAELKDKIANSYRYYNEKDEINDMELEALEDLIEAYEAAGGENSFVHSVVQKEMYTWKRVIR